MNNSSRGNSLYARLRRQKEIIMEFSSGMDLCPFKVALLFLRMFINASNVKGEFHFYHDFKFLQTWRFNFSREKFGYKGSFEQQTRKMENVPKYLGYSELPHRLRRKPTFQKINVWPAVRFSIAREKFPARKAIFSSSVSSICMMGTSVHTTNVLINNSVIIRFEFKSKSNNKLNSHMAPG